MAETMEQLLRLLGNRLDDDIAETECLICPRKLVQARCYTPG